MSVLTFVVHVALMMIWLLPIPKLVEINIDAIVETDLGLSSLNVKIIATICGIFWPIMLASAIFKFLFRTR
jgi:hypothetical protein